MHVDSISDLLHNLSEISVFPVTCPGQTRDDRHHFRWAVCASEWLLILGILNRTDERTWKTNTLANNVTLLTAMDRRSASNNRTHLRTLDGDMAYTHDCEYSHLSIRHLAFLQTVEQQINTSSVGFRTAVESCYRLNGSSQARYDLSFHYSCT